MEAMTPSRRHDVIFTTLGIQVAPVVYLSRAIAAVLKQSYYQEKTLESLCLNSLYESYFNNF